MKSTNKMELKLESDNIRMNMTSLSEVMMICTYLYEY